MPASLPQPPVLQVAQTHGIIKTEEEYKQKKKLNEQMLAEMELMQQRIDAIEKELDVQDQLRLEMEQ